MKKFLMLLLSCLVCGAFFFAVAACDNGGDGGDNGGDDDVVVPPGSQLYTFEAEYVDCSEIGDTMGFSGGGSGTDIVAADLNNALGSNTENNQGFYITCLYVPDLTVEFVINSDKAVSDATLVARLSAEGGADFSISTNNYTVTVNGEAIQYSPIQFRGVPALGSALPFQNYTLIRNLSLQEGENVIRFITSNSDSLGGTTLARAPMIDNIQITTSATLTWEPVTSNLDNF